MVKYLIIALIICTSALVISVKSCSNIKADRNRLSDNQNALLEKTTYYRTKDSLSAASVERLMLSKGELEKYCSELVGTCKDLNVKVKRLQSASTSATETKYNIQTILHDSIVIRDSLIIDTMKCISYEDTWLTFSSCTMDGINFDTKIKSRDTLVTLVHRVPRRFLFFRWGYKAIRQEVISKNPNSTIIYTEYIEAKKKK